MKKIVFIFTALCLLLSMVGISAEVTNNENLLIRGLDAYRAEDWTTALFFLRKASILPDNMNAETWYVLIMAEIFAGDLESVKKDGVFFIEEFPQSKYVPQVYYQMARAEFNAGEYDNAIRDFSDFCKQYQDHELYPSALFWTAEALYQTFNFTQAKMLFQKLSVNFPDNTKTVESLFRLELLEQREREEKLLYLLRVTGEEYLASREEYERQLKQYQSEEAISMRRQVAELTAKTEDLRTSLEETKKMNDALVQQNNELSAQNEEIKKIASETVKEAEATAAAALIKVEEATKLLAQKELEAEFNIDESVVDEPDVISTDNSEDTFVEVEPEDNEIVIELENLKQKAQKLQKLLDGQSVD